MSPLWFMVRGKLHDDTSLILFADQFSPINSGYQKQGSDGGNQHEQNNRHSSNRTIKYRCKHWCKGKRRSTRNTPDKNHRQKPLSGIVNDTASCNTCHITSQTHKKRTNTLPLQAQLLHCRIKDDRNSRHIAYILNNCKYKGHSKNKSCHGYCKPKNIWYHHINQFCQWLPDIHCSHQLF